MPSEIIEEKSGRSPASRRLAFSLLFILSGGLISPFLSAGSVSLAVAHGILMVLFGMVPFFILYLGAILFPSNTRNGEFASAIATGLFTVGGVGAISSFLVGSESLRVVSLMLGIGAVALESFRILLNQGNLKEEKAARWSLWVASWQGLLTAPFLAAEILRAQDSGWFWSIVHPAAFLLLAPALGVATDLLSDSTRRDMLENRRVKFALALLPVLGTTVAVHHVFFDGLSHARAFRFLAMGAGLPLAVIAAEWMRAIWKSSPRQNPASWSALAFVSLFLTGGVSGLFLWGFPLGLSSGTGVVAHFHYLVFGGTLFTLAGEIYRRFPARVDRPGARLYAAMHLTGSFTCFHLVFFPMLLGGSSGHGIVLMGSLGLVFFQVPFAWIFVRPRFSRVVSPEGSLG